MNKYRKTAAYLLCMVVACALLVAIAAPHMFTQQSDLHTSIYPMPTIAPLMGFAADSVFNVGSTEEIDAFPDIGEVYSQRIVEGRSIFGNYQLPEDLLLVKGIGEKRLAAMMEVLDEELVEIPLLMQKFAK